MAGELQDRVAVVTAAASGMGRATSLRFAEQGAHVVAIDLDPESGASLLDEITTAGGTGELLTVDLSDLGQIEDAVRSIESGHGRIDVLFNHAGAPGPRGLDFDADVWAFQADLNLRAPVFLTKLALPLMGQGSSIIFTSSVSGLAASPGSPVYAALKTAVIGYMRCIAAIGGPDGIRANAICPGAVQTPMLETFLGGPGVVAAVREERLTSFNLRVPLGRVCRPDEVADLVLFLASDRSSFITGHAVPIDGGYVAQ